MIAELTLRFVLGGLLVSLFAVAGELCRPKTFSGLFGAAPSVAIATLGLAYAKEGAPYVVIEARSMLIGAVALFVYCGTCIATTKMSALPVWLGATLSWTTWAAAAWASAPCSGSRPTARHRTSSRT